MNKWYRLIIYIVILIVAIAVSYEFGNDDGQKVGIKQGQQELMNKLALPSISSVEKYIPKDNVPSRIFMTGKWKAAVEVEKGGMRVIEIETVPGLMEVSGTSLSPLGGARW